MKKITLYLKDETLEALNKATEAYAYYKYPIEQAYSLIIDGLVKDIQKLPQCSLIPCCCCCCIPEHQHPPAWCMSGSNEE